MIVVDVIAIDTATMADRLNFVPTILLDDDTDDLVDNW